MNITSFILATHLSLAISYVGNINTLQLPNTNQKVQEKSIKSKNMDIKFQLKIKADAKTIFKAITTKKGYQGWWAVVCDVNCKLNQVSSIRFEKEHKTEEMRFKTIEVKENQKLVWLCTQNNVFETWVGTTLTFEIEQKNGYSNFIFIQTSSNEKWKQHSDYEHSVAGWDTFFNSLKKYCETGKGEPWG